MSDDAWAFSKVLLLGAIAAASAFVVTIFILLVCVGCQRKRKSKYPAPNGEKHKRNAQQNALRQSKLSAMSKSDTGLHELNRLACSANGGPKNRPVSMDLLLLHCRRSTTDLHPSHSRQFPHVPNGTGGSEQEPHTYSEVGHHRAPPDHCKDDGLYESVGVRRGESVAPVTSGHAASPSASPNTPECARRSQGAKAGLQEPVMAEYASIRKVRKVEKGQRKEKGEMEASDSAAESLHSHEASRKSAEPFHLHSFPKEAMFMGNGEQYIWKPPEEDDIIVPPGPQLENGQGHSAVVEISDMYSTVCKSLKKKPPQGATSQDAEGQHSLANQPHGEDDRVWLGGDAQEEARARRRVHEEPCYEPVGEKTWPANLAVELDPAYATIDSNWKRERQANTLKPKKKPMHSENLYETISEVKLGASASSTTTIFTFNDGMEMYVTGL
ncbi:uncharacterized protein LOC114798883 [Denticeps clupeoides]|uniref:Lck-interacting transmembrane adapter 1 n=1 Tax=Denticeps clupeoides TaxID=299321 RepID=A0AAY4AS26_9TELE|nr:lck-interacting transmembrane adapter 1 [Denticeps clupeoides]